MKFVYTGVGLAASATQRVQKAINNALEVGKDAEEEGKKVVDDLISDTQAKGTEIQERIKGSVNGTFSRINKLASNNDYDALKEKVEELEGQLETTAKKTTTRAKRTVKKVVKKVASEE